MSQAQTTKTENESASADSFSANHATLPPVMTVKEAALALRVSRWMIYQLIRKRELATFKIGSRRCVPAKAVDTLVRMRLAEEAA
jgi:excisionase family DNA binding protein